MRVFFFRLWIALSWSSAVIAAAQVQALPRQSQYLERGLQAGMSVGSVTRAGCHSRFHWQGSAEYAYAPYVSGGAAFRVFGGDIDGYHSLVYSRYFLYARWHAAPTSGVRLYAGPVLSVDKTDIRAIRDDFWNSIREEIEPPAASACSEAYAVNGAGLGWDAGISYAWVPWFNLTLGQGFEINVEKKFRLSLTPGMAVDLARKIKRLGDNAQAFWVHAEWVKSFNMNAGGSDNLYQLGFSLAF